MAKKSNKPPQESTVSSENIEKEKTKKAEKKAKAKTETKDEETKTETISVEGEAPQKKRSRKRKKSSSSKEGTSKKNEDATEIETAEGNEEESGEVDSSNKESLGAELLVKTTFESLPISENTKKALAEMSLTHLTTVQHQAIPPFLEGKDINARAKTGSGKTLAFVIPAIENVLKGKFDSKNGSACIILSPTRELSIQTHRVLKDVLKYHENLSHCLIMGGTNRGHELEKLLKSPTFIVATPGRLLDHLRNSPGFKYKALKMLVIDEADRILDIATESAKVQELAHVALKAKPVRIEALPSYTATVANLEQSYIVCPSESRFLLLFSFLKRKPNIKIIVFFSSCSSVKYHTELLNYIDVPAMSLHGKQSQQKRTSTFFKFSSAKQGILLCTDIAARGLDIPDVDWILQFDPPDDPSDYIHRVGRTARAGNKGQALLFLLPEEVAFLKYLKTSGVPLFEFEFPKGKIIPVQEQLEKILEKNFNLHVLSREAYRSYIYSYATHSLKHVFNVETLDLKRVAKQFGFSVPPKVDFNIESSGKQAKMSKKKSKVIPESVIRQLAMAEKLKKRHPKKKQKTK